MEIVVRGRNVSVTERVQEYVEKKVGDWNSTFPSLMKPAWNCRRKRRAARSTA